MSREGATKDSFGRDRAQFQTHITEKSLTEQADAKKADINHILKRAGVTGIVDHLRNVDEVFMDVSEFTDYADMMRHVRDAEVAFMKLPSKVREVFNHSVEEWLDAAHASPEELAERGILEAFGMDNPAATSADSGATAQPTETAGDPAPTAE